MTIARRRLYRVGATIEHEFEMARVRAEMPIDAFLLNGSGERVTPPLWRRSAGHGDSRPASVKDVYDAYMRDPTHGWSSRTRLANETTRKPMLAVLGEDTPIRSIDRSRCRTLIETLLWLPRNATKRFPGQHPVEIAERARTKGIADLISPSNVNTYLNKIGGVLNWEVREGLIDRNPAVGLRVPDPTSRRDRREPFTSRQLRAIFAAPLYSGCQDDGHGYAKPGPNRPKNARYWIPLISLTAGLRLNEACQLDVADVRVVDGVACFVITALASGSGTDKRLKTASSARLVPVHPRLIDLGLMRLVKERARAGEIKLFPEVPVGATGYRSATFSAWFARFVHKAGASSPRTCFHSLRHNFRDALREAGVDRDKAMALGGWTQPGGTSAALSVSEAYGSGYRAATLLEAISKVSFPELDVLTSVT